MYVMKKSKKKDEPFDTGKYELDTTFSMIDFSTLLAKIAPNIHEDNIHDVLENQYKITRTLFQGQPEFGTKNIKYESMPTNVDDMNCDHIKTNKGNIKHKLTKKINKNAKKIVPAKRMRVVSCAPNKNDISKELNCDKNRNYIHASPKIDTIDTDHVNNVAQNNHSIHMTNNKKNIILTKNKSIVNTNGSNSAMAPKKPTIDVMCPILRKRKQLSDLRTAKTSLNKILIGDNADDNHQIIFDAVTRTHQIIVHLYMFLRLFILDKYHRKQDIPYINRDFMSMAIKALILPGLGGQIPKGNNFKMLQEFEEFYETNYKHLGYDMKINGSNLSHVLAYMETDIITNIENNIKMHFTKYVNQFANSFFKPKFKILVEKTDKNNKVALKKQLDIDLHKIKQDLINHTLVTDSKYHEWIQTHRPHIFPAKIINSREFDISSDPQKYLKHVIYMSAEIEKTGGKSFQFFQIRSNMVPKYIPIDTSTLIDQFISKDKNNYFGNINACKKDLWKRIMNTSDPVFEQKHYIFDHRILTDGFAVSIQLINVDTIEKSQQRKNNTKKARNTTKELYADLSNNEIEVLKQKYEKKKRYEKIQNLLNRNLESDKKRDALNNYLGRNIRN